MHIYTLRYIIYIMYIYSKIHRKLRCRAVGRNEDHIREGMRECFNDVRVIMVSLQNANGYRLYTPAGTSSN